MSGSASRAALETVRARIGEVSGRAATSGGLIDLASELYAIADLLASQPQLRRSVGDPATALGARADLIGGLLEGKVSAEARDLARAAAEQRWSTPWDLAEGMEHLGDDALLRAAEQDGDLDEVEDQLFRFERILDSQSQLTTLLDEISVPAPRRTALLRDVIAGRVHTITRPCSSTRWQVPASDPSSSRSTTCSRPPPPGGTARWRAWSPPSSSPRSRSRSSESRPQLWE